LDGESDSQDPRIEGHENEPGGIGKTSDLDGRHTGNRKPAENVRLVF
jgi:hypothetical protein